MSRIPSLVVVLFVLSSVVVRGSFPAGDPIAAAPLPENIHVGADLAPVVVELFNRSETFRRQCAIIAAANVRVTIVVTVKLRPSVARARATIGPLGQGLWALIELAPVDAYAELLAHELEHVIEQIEGIDLAASGTRRRCERVDQRRGRATKPPGRARPGIAAAAEFYAAPDPTLAAAARAAGRLWRALSSRPEPAAWASKFRAGCHKDF